jgi:hypothetical protein
MDKNFDTWFSRFMWGTDIVFLAASTPHIAAWYAHFDNPSDWVSTAYAWIVGFGLAIAIDGVSLMLLFALTRMIKGGEKNTGTKVGILFFMAFIAGLSWLINWQYDKQFASTAFAKADGTTINLLVHQVTIGSLNPIIGGAFSILIMAYALIGKVVKEDEKPAMTDEEYEREKRRIERENELKQLRKSTSHGILAVGKAAMFGQSQGADELLEKALTYLRDARELLPVDQEERAVQALTAHLNIRSKGVLPVLIQARSIIEREDQEERMERATFDQEEDQEDMMNASTSGASGGVEDDQVALLDTLQGRETVSLEVAARALNCQVKYVVRLRNAGKLKHGPKRDDLITVASLRTYLAARGKRGRDVQTERLKVVPPIEEPASA